MNPTAQNLCGLTDSKSFVAFLCADAAACMLNSRASAKVPLAKATASLLFCTIAALLSGCGDEPREAIAADEPLLMAAKAGDIQQVQEHLKRGRSPNVIESQSGRTPLMLAAENGHLKVVEALIGARADVNWRIEPKEWRTGLPLPGWQSHSVRPTPGWTALLLAIDRGHMEVFDTLMAAGAEVNLKGVSNMSNNANDTTPLMLATQRGHTEMVRRLIDAGAHVKVSDLGGRTPLRLAANLEMLKLLEKAGADLSEKDAEGRTVLWTAVSRIDEAMIRYVVEAGADPNARDNRGTPVLMSALGNGVNVLVELGADVNAKDAEGKTLVQRMAQDGRYQGAVLRLYKLGASLESLTPWQAFLLLQDAVEAGDLETARAAITAGADVNEGRGYRGLSLSKAAYDGNSELVRLLLDAGADARGKTADGFTALHGASLMGRENVVGMLLEAGADVNATDKHGRTPLSVALQFNRDETARILREAGATLSQPDSPDSP